jgi:pilus assembly protein Flp/PilA
MLQFLQRLVNRKDEKGASAVEYGLLVAAIAALIVVIVFALGGLVKGVFTKTCTDIAAKATVSNSCSSASA